jgi:Putative adhesin
MSTQTFPLDGPIDLFVRIGHGSVTVETRDDLNEASVDIQPLDQGVAALPIAAVRRGTTLHVAGPREGALFELGMFGGRGRSAVDVRVVVPTHTAVKITTVDATIRVAGCVDGADIAFGRGQANLDLVNGDLRLRFGQGKARIECVAGSVEIRSGHGQVDLGEVTGDVRGGTGSGDVHVAVARGAVTLRCGTGNALLDEVHGDVDLTSGSGDLKVGLPAGVNARLQARTGSGRVRSDLPVDDAPSTSGATIDLRTRTGHGDVRIFRAA